MWRRPARAQARLHAGSGLFGLNSHLVFRFRTYPNTWPNSILSSTRARCPLARSAAAPPRYRAHSRASRPPRRALPPRQARHRGTPQGALTRLCAAMHGARVPAAYFQSPRSASAQHEERGLMITVCQTKRLLTAALLLFKSSPALLLTSQSPIAVSSPAVWALPWPRPDPSRRARMQAVSTHGRHDERPAPLFRIPRLTPPLPVPAFGSGPPLPATAASIMAGLPVSCLGADRTRHLFECLRARVHD